MRCCLATSKRFPMHLACHPSRVLLLACTLLGLHCGTRQRARDLDAPHPHAQVRGAFWESLGDLHHHVAHELGDRGPAGLYQDLYLTSRHATLTYAFPDSLLYAQAGQGVQILCDFLILDMLSLALHPDTSNDRLPLAIKPLQDLQGIRLYAKLRRDTEGATQQFDVFADPGELLAHGQDSLLIPVLWDNVDTSVIIRRGQPLNHLALAALKLHHLRHRLLSDLQARWGHRYQFLLPGDVPDGSRAVVTCAPLTLFSNHPNQRSPFEQAMVWKFSRPVEAPPLKR
jgi:hypothetical protein